MAGVSRIEELHQQLLHEVESNCLNNNDGRVQENEDAEATNLKNRMYIESKKLWQIVGPAIFSRIAS